MPPRKPGCRFSATSAGQTRVACATCPTGALRYLEGRGHAGKRTREEAGRRTEKQLHKAWSAP